MVVGGGYQSVSTTESSEEAQFCKAQTTDLLAVEFFLQDDDLFDEFTVLVKRDTAYATPHFTTVGGQVPVFFNTRAAAPMSLAQMRAKPPLSLWTASLTEERALFPTLTLRCLCSPSPTTRQQLSAAC